MYGNIKSIIHLKIYKILSVISVGETFVDMEFVFRNSTL